jgi:flagellin
MLSVQTNVSAISAQRHLGATSDALSTSMERLSSGFRINRAADDAAGLAVSEKLKAQIGGLNQASRNSQDGISMIQTAEGALSEVQSMMQRMRDLSVQAASDSNSQTERQNINLELGQLQQEIDSISSRTKFNGQGLLDGSLTSQQATSTYVATWNETVQGTVMRGTTGGTAAVGSVVSVDVSGASAATGYKFSSDTTAGTITLTQVNTSGVTTGLSQTLNASAMGWAATTGGTAVLNFSQFGVKVNLANSGAMTGADLEGSFAAANKLSIDTATGSGTATLQTGANQGDSTAVSFVDTRLTGASQAAMQDLNTKLGTFNTAALGTDASAARAAAGNLITSLDAALGYISSSRATLGAAQNRLQHTIANLGTTSENLSASNSRIRDVDVATESSNMAKSQVLEQAGVSVLAQANQLPQLALKLLG